MFGSSSIKGSQSSSDTTGSSSGLWLVLCLKYIRMLSHSKEKISPTTYCSITIHACCDAVVIIRQFVRNSDPFFDLMLKRMLALLFTQILVQTTTRKWLATHGERIWECWGNCSEPINYPSPLHPRLILLSHVLSFPFSRCTCLNLSLTNGDATQLSILWPGV